MTTLIGCLALYVFWRFIVWDYKRTIRLEEEHKERIKYEVPDVVRDPKTIKAEFYA